MPLVDPQPTPDLSEKGNYTEVRDAFKRFGFSIVKRAMQSSNYVSGSAGWKITAEGNLEANSGTFRGDLIAGSIHIPDKDTTANSFHINSNGDSWWGCTETDFDEDNNNAAAYILKTGVVKFQTGSFGGTLSAPDGTLGTITAGLLTGTTIKTSTDSSDARIYMTGSVLRSYSAAKADVAWEIEINSKYIDFYEYNTTNKKTGRISSGVDQVTIRTYDVNEASSETYNFDNNAFYASATGGGTSLGASAKPWTNAWIYGLITGQQVTLTQTSSTGNTLYVYRNKPLNTTDDHLVEMINDNDADDKRVLNIKQDADADAVYIETHSDNDSVQAYNDGGGSAFHASVVTTDGNSFFAYNTTNGYGLEIDHLSNSASDIYSVKIVNNNGGTGLPGAIDISSFSASEPLFKLPTDNTDPTSGGGAATGRIAVDVGGAIKYIPYY